MDILRAGVAPETQSVRQTEIPSDRQNRRSGGHKASLL